MPVVQSQCPDVKVALNNLHETQSKGQAKTSPSAEEDSVGAVISSDDKSSVVYSMYAAQAGFVAGASSSKHGREGYRSGHYITICAQLSYPLSRGIVHFRSASMTDKPNIDPKFLTHPMDLEVLAHRLQCHEILSTTEPLASLLKPQSLRKPDFAAGRRDLKAAEENLGRTVLGAWHPVGTCAMRPRGKGGVVNERLIVHGSTNLRVVDRGCKHHRATRHQYKVRRG